MKTERKRIGDVEVAYDVRGRGAPLLLIPGLTMCRVMWSDEICDALAERGFTVVRMDPRDAGESTRLDALGLPNIPKILKRVVLGLGVEVPYRLEDMAREALALMHALGHQRFHVAGTSMGGMIAQTLAIEHTDAVASLTSVMSSPGGRRDSIGDPRALWKIMTPVAKGEAAQIAQLVGTFRVLAGAQLPVDEAVLHKLAAAQVAVGRSAASGARQFAAVLESAPRRKQKLARLPTPTLIVHGPADPLLPLRGARSMVRLMPRAALHVIDGMGHFLPQSIVAELVDAIASHALIHSEMEMNGRG